MSVAGELGRVAGDLVGFLETCDGEDAASLAGRLRAASRAAHEDVSPAAEHMLALLDAAAPALPSALQRQEFERLREHLVALCRVILGR